MILWPFREIDGLSPAHSRPMLFVFGVRHASVPEPVKGQAPPVPGVVVQAGRVLARASAVCGPHHPAFPTP